uniref:Uncharacterized protein n=1 Tax=Daphnia magna TaxID=35525 RepID=A0A0P6D4L0_9CRUS
MTLFSCDELYESILFNSAATTTAAAIANLMPASGRISTASFMLVSGGITTTQLSKYFHLVFNAKNRCFSSFRNFFCSNGLKTNASFMLVSGGITTTQLSKYFHLVFNARNRCFSSFRSFFCSNGLKTTTSVRNCSSYHIVNQNNFSNDDQCDDENITTTPGDTGKKVSRSSSASGSPRSGNPAAIELTFFSFLISIKRPVASLASASACCRSLYDEIKSPTMVTVMTTMAKMRANVSNTIRFLKNILACV